MCVCGVFEGGRHSCVHVGDAFSIGRPMVAPRRHALPKSMNVSLKLHPRTINRPIHLMMMCTR